MSQFFEEQGEFYEVNGVKYDSRFPEEWARNHLSVVLGERDEPDDVFTTGPEECKNCEFYGSFQGVFVGYCSNCARGYNYERGGGFLMDYSDKEMWEKLPYMKGVKKNRIGVYVTYDEVDEDEPRYKKTVQQKRQMKRAKKREIRRALRKRRDNDEYLGMPLEPLGPLNYEMEYIIISIIVSILAALAGLSFYLI